SLPDNQCIHRWNNEQTLISGAKGHHHVSGRVLGDANTCPLRTLPLQVEHSFHVILLPIRCLPIQPKREAICRVCWRAGKCLAQRSEEHTSELQSLAYIVCRLLL